MKNYYKKYWNLRISKTVALATMILILANYSKAQTVNSMTFTSTVTSYTTITGGTQVSTSNYDAGYDYALKSIGFNFIYHGATFSQVGISSSGYIRLGATTTWQGYGLLSNYICALMGNLVGAGFPTSNIRIETSGSAPNRICTIQWRDWTTQGTLTNPIRNFQIRLYETTNAVEIVYGFGGAPTSYSRTFWVGITGASTSDYCCLTTTTSWIAPTIASNNTSTMLMIGSVSPSVGRTYRWYVPTSIDSVGAMQVSSPLALGSTNNAILGAVYYTKGIPATQILNQLVFNTSGSTRDSDITAARILCTGNVSTFSSGAAIRQFGSNIINPNGTMIFNGFDTLLLGGNNYYWLVYDVTSSSSSIGHVLDAQFVSATDSVTHVRYPTNGNPAGNRTIIPPLNGIYTINPAGNGISNFISFASAVSMLYSSAGISGPVTFLVSPGTYNEQVIINGPIIGASATNIITFDGGNGNAATRIISQSIGSSTVVVNQAKYISFRNLTINNTYPSLANFCGIAIVGTSNNYNGTGCSVKRCIINLTAQTSTYNYGYGINVTGTANGIGQTAMGADSIELDSNIINGGGWSICEYGSSSTSFNRGLKVRYNITNNTNAYGIAIGYCYNPTDIMYNTINLSTSYGGYGINFIYNTSNNSVIPHRITGNRINNFGQIGISTNYCNSGSGAANVQIHNNIIIGATTSSGGSNNNGIFLTENPSTVVEVYHNDITLKYAGTATNFSCLYNNGSTQNLIKNNIFTVTAGSGTPVYLATNLSGNLLNNNVYYNSAGTNLIYRSGIFYTNSNYLSAAAGGNNSYNMVPPYLNFATGDYHLTNLCLRGFSSGVLTDIDGNPRLSIPNIGAYEVPTYSLDLQAKTLLAPLAPTSYIPLITGLQDLRVSIKNIGSTTITSFNVSYKLNNGTPVTQYWTGSLNTCDTTTVLFTGSQSINLGSINNILVYTDSPNYSSDNYPVNDTIKVTYFGPISGTYTIGGASANFPNFLSATNALTSGGVSGPVTFLVNAGTYNEQVIINGPVPGTSATNTVTFEGGSGNASTRIISQSISSATVLIKQSKYITFRNLTINNNWAGISPFAGIAVVGSASSNNGTGCAVKRCLINLTPMTGTNIAGFGINFTGSLNGLGQTALGADSIIIDSNTINGGGTAISIYGSGNTLYNRGIKIRYNTSYNSNYYGGFIARNFNPVDIMYNTFNMASTYGYVGLYDYFNQSSDPVIPHRLIGNRVNNFGVYGIYVWNSNSGSTAANAQIYNNIAINSASFGGTYGLFSYQNPGSVVEFFHNDITMNYSGTNSNNACFFNTASSASIVKNNIFSVTAGSATPVYLNTNLSGNNINYNVYYNAAGSNLIYRNGTFFTNANFLSNTAGGDTSYNFPPPYMNLGSGDYHLTNGCLKGFASGVSTDIEGNTRSATPNIGAYEYSGVSLDISPSEIISPVAPVLTGLQNLRVRIRNNGSTIVTSFNIAYRLNNGTPVIQTWTGSLNTCDTTSVLFTGSQQLNLPYGPNNIQVYTYTPNSGIDLNRSNDTINMAYITLPVKLLSLKANNNSKAITISWVTASEINSNYFNIERSSDGKVFEKIGKVIAAGNSNRYLNYSFEDEYGKILLASEPVYYRLSMVDLDGSFEYSKIVEVNKYNDENVIAEIFPNPFNNQLVLKVENSKGTNVNIEIIDLNGKQYFKGTYSEGTNTIVNLESLPAGLYFAKIISNDNCKVFKLIKK